MLLGSFPRNAATSSLTLPAGRRVCFSYSTDLIITTPKTTVNFIRLQKHEQLSLSVTYRHFRKNFPKKSPKKRFRLRFVLQITVKFDQSLTQSFTSQGQ